ncbi:la-related protein 6-like [Acanthaster planci]|uniref:La-related protein 6-like n=1 Tax=Acanthaster planci TaxID=133434 RepID=A0A8B7ZLU6_ACAPL|nr:la-related protein 6-like [Acanthaster planci]
MSESAALETTENGTDGLASQQLATGDGQTTTPSAEPNSPSAPGLSTSPVTIHIPPLVQISSPPEPEPSGDDAGGDTSSGSLSDGRNTPGKERSNTMNESRSDGRGGENAEWTPPDEELKNRIIKQVEFYFSDANITKDAFLLKHVRRNKEGFVSLKLITSFKKVKSLSKDWRTVRYSLKSSTTLEVNEEGTKVKRKAPLPDYDETSPSRTVVAVNLPTENPSIESIAELFSKCGEISLIRILRPGKPFPPDVRKHIERHSEVRNKVCALIEFESGQSALKAAKVMSDKDNWRTGMSVTVLAKEKKEKKQSQEKTSNRKSAEGLSPSQAGDLTASDGGEGGDSAKKKKRQRKKKNARVEELSAERVEQSGTPSSSDTENSPLPSRRHASKAGPVPQSKSPAHLSPSNTPKSSPNPSPHGSPRQQRKVVGRSPLANSRSSPRASPEMGRKVYDSFSDHSNTSSPWVQRRKLLAASAPEGSPAGSPLLGRKNLMHNNEHESILRSPFGPDGTRGFSIGRGRGRPKSVGM